MSWTAAECPSTISTLPPRAQKKALKLANVLLKSGYEESRVEELIQDKVEEWGADVDDEPAFQKARRHRPGAYHVRKGDDGWRVEREGNQRASTIEDTQREALRVARRLAAKHKVDVVVHRARGGVSSRFGVSKDAW